MRRLTGAIIVGLLVALLAVPVGLFAQQLPVPVEKSVFPGTTTLQYAGQTFVFTSSVQLRVSFKANTDKEIEITVRAAASRSTDPYSSTGSQTEQLVINWKNFNEDIYNGNPPTQPWTGVLNTEGGWTEK